MYINLLNYLLQLDAEGKYNVDQGLSNLSKYIKSDENRAALEEVAKECATG